MMLGIILNAFLFLLNGFLIYKGEWALLVASAFVLVLYNVAIMGDE